MSPIRLASYRRTSVSYWRPFKRHVARWQGERPVEASPWEP